MQCDYLKQGGERCGSNALSGKKLCFFHSSDTESKRKIAQSSGGKANKIAVKDVLPPVALQKLEDVVLLLEDTVNRVRSGELDVRIGNCIGVLSGHVIKALEVVTVSNRVEIIERAILERTTRIN